MREKLCEVWPIYVMCLHLSFYLYGTFYDMDATALERCVCIDGSRDAVGGGGGGGRVIVINML